MIRILKSLELTELEKEINKELKNGWEPVGGVSVAKGATSNLYIQTIKKTRKKNV